MAGSGGSYHSLNSLFGLNIKLVLFLSALQNLKYIHAILLMTYRHYFLVIKLLSEKARMVSDCHFPQVPDLAHRRLTYYTPEINWDFFEKWRPELLLFDPRPP